MPRLTRARQTPLTPGECLLLVGYFDRHWTSLAPSVRLMVHLGFRVGEALAARRSWITDLESPDATITVPAECSKNGASRTLPMPSLLRVWLLNRHPRVEQELPPEPATDPCLTRNRWGAPPSQIYLARRLRHASRAAIGRGIRSHTLRHTFATTMLRTTNLRVVQHMLGHKSIATTQLYTHPNMADLKEAMDKWDFQFCMQLIAERVP